MNGPSLDQFATQGSVTRKLPPKEQAMLPEESKVGLDRDEVYSQVSDTLQDDTNEMDFQVGLSETGKRRRQERIEAEREARLTAIEPDIQAVASREDIPLDVRISTIDKLRAEVINEGTSPKNLAIDDLIAVEMDQYETERDQSAAAMVAMNIRDAQSVRSALDDAAMAVTAATESSGALETVGEFLTAEMVTYLSKNVNTNRLLSAMFGVEEEIWMSIHSGDNVLSAQEYAQNLSPEDKVAAIKRGKDFMLNNTGIVFDNKFQAQHYIEVMETAFGSELQGAVYNDAAVFDAVVGVVTSVSPLAIAKGAKGAVNAVKGAGRGAVDNLDQVAEQAARDALNPNNGVVTKDMAPRTGLVPTTPAHVINTTVPNASEAILRAAVRDPETAIRLGTTPNQIVEEAILFKGGSEVIRRGATLMGDRGVPRVVLGSWRNGTTPDRVKTLAHNPDLIPDEQVAQQVAELESKMTRNRSVRVHQSRLIGANKESDTLGIQYAIGRENGAAFHSIEEANEFAQTRLPKRDIKDSRILGLDPKTGEYREDVIDADEYLIQVDYSQRFADHAIRRSVFKEAGPRLANQLATTTRYIKSLAMAVNDIDNVKSLIAKQFSDNLEPLKNLNVSQKDKLWRLLKEEETLEREFAPSKIADRFNHDPELADAYNGVRTFYREVWGTRNDLYRDSLKSKGYHSYIDGDGATNFVRPHSNHDDVVTVWHEGQVKDFRTLRQTGDFDILESQVNKGDDAGLTKFIAVPRGTTAQYLNPLPSVVLREVPGYLGRRTNAEYVVYRPTAAQVNGANVPGTGEAVYFADNALDAERVARENGLLVRQARSTHNTLDDDLESLSDLGLTTNTRKRATITDMDASYVGSLESPEEMLIRTRDEIADTVGMEQFYQHSRQRWLETYGRPLGIDEFPVEGDIQGMIRGKLATESNRLIEEAQAFRDKITLVVGVDPMTLGQRYKNSMVTLAENMARASVNPNKRSALRALDRVGYEASNILAKDPSKVAKAAVFKTYIAWNTARQLLLQAGNAPIYAGVKHNSKYFGTGEVNIDAAGIAALNATEKGSAAYNSAMKIATAGGRRTEQEMEDLVQLWNDTGLGISVSRHQYSEYSPGVAGVRGHEGLKATGAEYNWWDKTKSAARAVDSGLSQGFITGEKVNKTYAFLATRQKFAAEGRPLDARTIAQEANILTGEMNTASRSAFQRGDLSFLFQFQSHSVRMMQQLIPSRRWGMGDDMIDNPTKLRLGLWNLAVYGSGGYGMGAAVTSWWKGHAAEDAREKGLDFESPENKALFEFATNGVAQVAWTKGWEALTGTEVNSTIGSTMSPYSNIFGVLSESGRPSDPVSSMAALAYSVATQSPDAVRQLGPAGGLVGSVGNAVGTIQDIFNAPAFDSGEKGAAIALEIGRVLPMFNNATIGTFAGTTGVMMSRNGNPQVSATTSDAFAKAMFGINTDAQERLYDYQAKYLSGRISVKETGDKLMRAEGRDMARGFAHLARLFNSGSINKNDMTNRMAAAHLLLRSKYGDGAEMIMVNAAFDAELKKIKVNETTTAFDDFMDAIVDSDEIQVKHGVEKKIEILRKQGSKEADFLANALENLQY